MTELMALPVQAVGDFRTSTGLQNNPLHYPGERPPHSYLLAGDTVLPVAATGGEYAVKTIHDDVMPVNEYLSAREVPKLEERIPLLSFGANVCPASLKRKCDPDNDRPDLAIVPTIYGEVTGFDVVWGHVPGQRGNHIAQPYVGPETQHTSVQVGVNFLTAEQVYMLDFTEGAYERARYGNVTLEGGTVIPAFLYAGRGSIALHSGEPLAVEAVPAIHRTLRAVDARTMLAETLEVSGVQESVRHATNITDTLTPESYVQAAAERNLAGKKALQAVVRTVLKEGGHVGQTNIIDMPGMYRWPWAHPNVMPTFAQLLDKPQGLYGCAGKTAVYQMAGMVLGSTTPARRAKVLARISTHCDNGITTSGGL